MTPPEPLACTACAHHVQRGKRHLCALVAQAYEVDIELVGATETLDLLSCDRMRRMRMVCGPAGALWEPRQA